MSPRPPRSTTTATLFPYTPLFRSPHGRAVANWIAPLFAGEAPADGRVRLAASLLSDVAWSANPDFRAERGTEIGLYGNRSEEHTSELQSLMRISYAVFCLKKKITSKYTNITNHTKKIKT